MQTSGMTGRRLRHAQCDSVRDAIATRFAAELPPSASDWSRPMSPYAPATVQSSAQPSPSPAIPRERFIPVRRADVVAACLADIADEAARREFAGVNALLASIFHFEFHRQLEELKDLYAPLDPDSDTKTVRTFDAAGMGTQRAKLVTALSALMERANYHRLSGDDLNRALAEESVFNVTLHTELDDFAELVLFCRGSAAVDEPRRGWFGLKKWTQRVDYFQRVAIYTRFKERDHFTAKGLTNLPFTPGSSILKLFQNIPRADLEMLFPNTDVRMKTGQKLLVGVPAIAGGLLVLVTKLGASLVLIGVLIGWWIGLADEPQKMEAKEITALGLGLFALLGYLVRQLNAFKSRRARFLKTLTDSLYFKNLDNNAGVFSRVVDEAEEEEAKEAVLAYAFLHASAKPLTAVELDGSIEAWLRDELKAECDFEIDDGLAKLERLELVERDGDRLRAVPIAEARRRLDARWDGLYSAP